MACQWTDEQTGGHCPTWLQHFTGTERKWFTFTNGVHTDSLDPETFNRWYDFMQLYIARAGPSWRRASRRSRRPFTRRCSGVRGVTLPDDPIQEQPTLASAKAAFEAQPRSASLFDNGAGSAPVASRSRATRALVPDSSRRAWSAEVVVPGKRRQELKGKPGGAGADQFTWDADARPPPTSPVTPAPAISGPTTPSYDWTQPRRARRCRYVSRPLPPTPAVLGAGEVQVWVRSQAENVDLQATVTEVRPDGKETFVQGGWLRTESRKIDAWSQLDTPLPTYASGTCRRCRRASG